MFGDGSILWRVTQGVCQVVRVATRNDGTEVEIEYEAFTVGIEAALGAFKCLLVDLDVCKWNCYFSFKSQPCGHMYAPQFFSF